MPRPKKTAAELQATREQILDTALAILQESGPQAISSRAIAERLGVAHMFLFTYFKNQACILNALREREMARWGARQAAIAQRAETGSVPQVVRALLELFSTFARENPNLYRLAWVMPEAIGENPEDNRRRTRETVGNLSKLLALGMERGDFERRDPFLAAGTVLGMVNTPYILFHTGKMIDPVMRERMVAEMLSAAATYLQKK